MLEAVRDFVLLEIAVWHVTILVRTVERKPQVSHDR